MSALLELTQTAVAARLVGPLVGGRIATCDLIDLQLLAHVARDERAEVLRERRQFPRVACGEEAADRALAVQAQLDGALPTADQLLVAAAAELAGLVLLHHDPVFERIADVTGQAVERVS